MGCSTDETNDDVPVFVPSEPDSDDDSNDAPGFTWEPKFKERYVTQRDRIVEEEMEEEDTNGGGGDLGFEAFASSNRYGISDSYKGRSSIGDQDGLEAKYSHATFSRPWSPKRTKKVKKVIQEEIVQYRTWDTKVDGRFERIEYGTFYGKPAMLAVMKYTFHPIYPNSGTRFKNARIEAEFSAVDSKDPLKILAWAPELAYGGLSKDQTRYIWEVSSKVGFSAYGGSVEAIPRYSCETTVERGHRVVIQGSVLGNNSNGVLWTAEESPISNNGILGIPKVLRSALILEHTDQHFQGKFTLHGGVGLTLSPKHWWDHIKKVQFDPSKPFLRLGTNVIGPIFDHVTEELVKLTGFSEPA